MHHCMMTRDQINAFCGAQPATTHVVQWGNSDVWKVGGKVFAVCGWNEGRDAVTFKVSKLAFEVLQDAPGIRPAPYLASRGMSWLQVYGDPGLNDKELCEHIVASYQLVVVGLTKARRADLGV